MTPTALCVRCQGASGHPAIPGEGDRTACYPCIVKYGRAAAEPARLLVTEAALLLEAHGDVVALSDDHRRWEWRADGGDALDGLRRRFLEQFGIDRP